MGSATRFNLELLRSFGPLRTHEREGTVPKASPLSRREFLQITGAGAAYAGYTTIPQLLRKEPFSVVRDGSKIHFLVENQPRWTIDPELFGRNAVANLDCEGGSIHLSLRDALFPGTQLPASFESIIQKSDEGWTLALKMDSGLTVDAEFVPWLLGRLPASGRWKAKSIKPFDGFALEFEGPVQADYRPDWSFSMRGRSTAIVRGLHAPLHSNRWRTALNEGEPIAGGQLRDRTTFTVFGQRSDWKVDLNRSSDAGWQLSHEDNLFDVLKVEGANLREGPIRTAFLFHDDEIAKSQQPSAAARDEATLKFRPGNTLCTDCDEPFVMPLRNARLAFSLDEEFHSSLVADLSDEPIWAHDNDVSYLLGRTPDAPHFELHEGAQAAATPQISPGICEICFPNDSACMNLKLGVPRPVPFTWADFISPFERLAGWLHILPSQNGHKLVIDLQNGDRLHIDRPLDMLSLQFGFDNMRLVTGGSPRIVRAKGTPDPRIKVFFPPQHVAEQAYFHTDDPNTTTGYPGITKVQVPIGAVEVSEYGDPAISTPAQLAAIYDPDVNTPGATTDPLPAMTAFSSETQLVFGLPPHKHEIPCHLEALLDWQDWLPVVAPVAQSDVDTSNLSNLPQIVSPYAPTPYTSIELPYRLSLSPSELGRWAHSIKPVESEKKIVELWHTRLGVVPKQRQGDDDRHRMLVDEANSKDRVVRAIWSPDFQAVSPLSCKTIAPIPEPFPAHYDPHTPVGPASPFRMSLDARDRCELVHLTSNYAITQQMHFCDNGQPMPADPKNLLAPAPVQINRMILSAMGGYLDAFGQWNPSKVDMNHQLTVQLWKHHATLGRDHYVKVLYKGYLIPFGLRASLVKVTQRYFEKNSGGWVAILHQHMYIVVKNERKQCPIMGQPYTGREFPFSYVEPVTLTTPFLNDPGSQLWPKDGSTYQTQSLFWPMLGPPANPVIFNFRLRFTDITGVHSAESSMPLAFVGSDVAQQDGFGSYPNFCSQDAVRLYNAGSGQAPNPDDLWLSAKFNGQKFSFAKSVNPGDTDFETDTIAWRAAPLTSSISGTLSNAPANAFVTLTETTSGTTYVQTPDSSGAFHFVTDSGSYIVTVTTPRPAPASPSIATTPAYQLAGNATYTLNLALNAGGTGFTAAPVLTQGASTGPSPIDLYHYDLPYFYPAVDYARITSTSIKRVTGSTTPTKFNFFPTYLNDGFNKRTNTGEVVLQKSKDDSLSLAFGAAGNVDQAGGLSSPDVLVVGFSRKAGAIGGKMDSTTTSGSRTVVTSASTFSTGKFDPADFFGGLTSAKLLGAVKLADIIAPLASDLASNLEKAPQMIEQSVYAAEQEVSKYLQMAVSLITDFQKLPNNPIATCVSSQAQQVFAANDALNSASPGDVVDVGILEGQVIARLADYASAVGNALQNPASLIEDAILNALASVIQNVVGAATATIVQQLNSFAAKCDATLDAAIQSVLVALSAIQNKLNDVKAKVADAMTGASQLLATVAPELNNLVALADVAADLKNKIAALGQSINKTTTPTLSLQQIPQLVGDISGIVADVQQIYQKAGYLGVVISKATAGSTVTTALNTAETKLHGLWVASSYAASLDALQTDCIKLASDYGNDSAKAQLVLQNLRQLQNSVNRAAAYKANSASDSQSEYRRLQLLQKMQGHILRALSVLQTLATQLPPGASASVQAAAADILTAAPVLAASLTVSTQLLSSPNTVEQLIATVTSDPDLVKPLAASAADYQEQLVALRAQIAASPANLALQLLHYNLSIDYQRAVASAQSYILYLQSAGDDALAKALNNLTTLLAPVEQFATQLKDSFCALQTVWTSFTAAIQTVTGPNSTSTVGSTLGTIIQSLFSDDFRAITTAFSNLCSSAQTTPSEFLRNGQQLAAAFVTLETDIRSKAPSLSTLEAALTDALKQQAQQLLTQILGNIPIPTSVNLSYTWKPTIQSFEPVFVLNDDASFTVTASAQAGLNSQLNGITAAVDIEAELKSFSINLIGEETFITLEINSLSFTSHNGSKPDCRLNLKKVDFGAAMQFVQELADTLDPSEGPFIELAADSIRAGFRFAIASMTMGAFNLMQLAIEVAVALPFDGSPVRCEFGLSDQQQPFLLSCGIYGGGGFLQLQLGLDGVQLLQGALEFGVCAAISIGPLEGSGFVVAGIYFRITSNTSEVCGFVHAHGHMDIFGIITMDVDLYVTICYQDGSVTGLATFSVSVSIAFFSESFTMSAQYTFAGSSSSTGQVRAGSWQELPVSGGPSDLGLYAIETDSGEMGAKGKGKAGAACPGPWKSDLFIDQKVWSQYFNSFA